VDVLPVSSLIASSILIGGAANGEVLCYSLFLLFSSVYFSCWPGPFSYKGFVMYPRCNIIPFSIEEKGMKQDIRIMQD
jgi:hypothetical protein